METVCTACLMLNCVPGNCLHRASLCQHCGHVLCSGHVIEATRETLDKLLCDDLPVVVDFSATWCRPCRNFAPVFADVAAERCGKMRFVKVDADSERELINRFGIKGIPTIMIFKNGQVLDVLSGVEPKAPFNHWLDETLCLSQHDITQ